MTFDASLTDGLNDAVEPLGQDGKITQPRALPFGPTMQKDHGLAASGADVADGQLGRLGSLTGPIDHGRRGSGSRDDGSAIVL